jgi:hypothetical protein
MYSVDLCTDALPVMAEALAVDEQIGDSNMAPPLLTAAVLLMKSELLMFRMPPAVEMPPPPARTPVPLTGNNIVA